MSIPITKIIKTFGPAQVQISFTYLTAAPQLQSQQVEKESQARREEEEEDKTEGIKSVQEPGRMKLHGWIKTKQKLALREKKNRRIERD